MGNRLLLVDDETRVIDFMRPFLEGEGFQVCSADNGQGALQLAQEQAFDLVILDWMLPGMSGLEVCRELRRTSKVGIIMVTVRTDEMDRVIGLEVGADDYLVKPFGLRELVARIRSVLRRMADLDEEPPILHSGELEIDEAKFRVTKNGEDINLTPTEFKILVSLAGRPGVVRSRLQLLRAAMGDEYLNYERTIDTHVSHLRQKIEDDPAEPKYIQTVYGMGYRFGDQI